MTASLDIGTSFTESDRLDGNSGARLVRGLRLDDPQTEGPLTVLPLFSDGDDGSSDDEDAGSRYVTLHQALGEGSAVITELNEGGSIPELRVTNRGDAAILMLDGEELRGAKQNRVLASTILVERRTTLVVPVSCTEQGRWSYASREFAESEVMAERQLRYAMRRSSHTSMLHGAGVHADQRAVWSEVRDLHLKHGTRSATSAMRDAYEARKRDLDRVVAAFPLMDGQQGLLVVHGSRVVGLDFVSQAPQYAELHDKLLRSYVFEALVRSGEPGGRSAAEAFLERISGLQGQRFKSPGLGWDMRFEGGGVLGSTLVHRGHVVHAAFFDVGGAKGSADEQLRDRRPSWSIFDARQSARRRWSR